MRIHEKFSAFAQSLKFIETHNHRMDIGYHLIEPSEQPKESIQFQIL